MMTRQLLNKRLNEGDISTRQVALFYKAAQKFFMTATQYALDHLPFKDHVLKNAAFSNLEHRESADISQVSYFISRLVNIFHIVASTSVT